MKRMVMIAMAAILYGCGQKPSTIDDLTSTEVVLPNGDKIRAEVMREQSDLIRGMMFRDSLPQNRGMLFYLMRETPTPYYTFQVKIPLDIMWMDHNRQIVEIVRNVPPCPATKAQECPTYGGRFPAQFVLEANAGFAANHGLKEGDRLEF
jgi:uncharacterized membrane protein (UPF0127 family)